MSNPDVSPVKLYLGKSALRFGKLSSVKIKKQRKETLVDDHTSAGEELAKSLTSKNRLFYLSAVYKKICIFQFYHKLPSIWIKL